MLSAGRVEHRFESSFFEARNRFLSRFEAAIPAADSLRYNLELAILRLTIFRLTECPVNKAAITSRLSHPPQYEPLP